MASLIVGLDILLGPRPRGRRFGGELFNILVGPFRLRGTTAATRIAAVPGVWRFRHHFSCYRAGATNAGPLSSRIRSEFHYPLVSGRLQHSARRGIPLKNLAIQGLPLGFHAGLI